MADVLSDYETEVRRLLHDANANYWSNTDLDDYINLGRNHVVTDTGCLRQYQTAFVQPGTEFYTFGGLWQITVNTGGSLFTSAPTVVITPASGDTGVNATATCTISNGAVNSVTVKNQGNLYNAVPSISFSGGGGSGATATAYLLTANTVDLINPMIIWGSQRIPLQGKVFTDLNAAARVWTSYKQRPGLWSMYGTNQICVAPIPDQAYQFEADTVVLPAALSGTTPGNLIPPATEAVPYWAAYLAKLNEKQFEEASAFKNLYNQQIQWAVNIFTIRAQGVYGDNANFDTFN